MKRKVAKKALKHTVESHGTNEPDEKNGGSSNYEEKKSLEIDEPKEKKKKSKTPKKNVLFSSKQNEENSVENEDVDTEKQPKVKDKKKKTKTDEVEETYKDDEIQYEVKKIIDDKNIKGARHYLIRWKGYEEESDTWEPEDNLSCPDLIQAYKNSKKTSKAKKGTKKEQKEETWDENEDFEVKRILEVHRKKEGKREFLVSWKGYSNKDNSWEPEENMDCKDLIQKFMAKAENAKNVDEHELRVNRKNVQRLNTADSNRRLSRRNKGKERVQYHDAE